MRLSAAQLEQYERDGFVVLPGLFSAGEVDLLKSELARIGSIETDHIIRERSGGVAKAIYRAHEADGPTASPVFRAAVRAPRMLGPARDILGDEQLYIYHCKCNLKTAIDGSIWQWHQDFGTWRHDGTPSPDLTTGLVMLDEATEANGCLYFIPGSHRLGSLEPELDDTTTSYRLWVVPKARLIEIMEQSPEPVAITGKPGDVVFFHPNILHGSGHNMSRHDRWQAYFVYNRVANRPRDVQNPRPDYVRSTNFAPLEPGDDDIAAPVGQHT
ncbi:phytanoyl-CoA dioxygenase family protein [Pseudonocardia acidicola]|uniref:Phytanoyl-CoA dioxygenase n=1 Tax=Pseudonocardia acidicola TaxID=2724939 RepID=A0ABX1S2F1_9PSEU|nr:phytanoyl-CoA dioxygenase family protein [Pseudonocardia acidicola]NMH95738.1 phytanoyl-CoA dioxygenase [Pseudonocardia acidicola]